MAKRKMSANQLKNLEKGNLANKSPDERKEIARRGAEAANKVKREKRSRENMLSVLFEMLDKEGIIDGTVETVKVEVKHGNLKNAIELLKLVKPNELQEQKIIGGLEVQKVFITEKEQKETRKHIRDVINEQ